MARNRMIKSTFWEDDRIAQVDFQTRLFFIALWNIADDEGFIEYRAEWIKAKCFPYDEADIHGMINELSRIDRLEVREHDDKTQIIFVKNFRKHQSINRAQPSALSQKFNDSRSIHGAFTERSYNKIKVKERKVKESKYLSDSHSETNDCFDKLKIAKKNFSDETKKLSDFLFSCIQKNNPGFKADPRKWDEEVDRMLRIDGRLYEEAVQVIMFCQSDSFWRSNILSGEKLRKQYDQLIMKAKDFTVNNPHYVA